MADINEVSLLFNQPYIHNSLEYQVVREWEVNGNHYAIMRQEQDHPDDSMLFRIQIGQIEEIESENEWESIIDAIDEFLHSDNI